MVKVRVRVGKSRIAGQGLFTVQDIKKDTRILPYVGERISKKESVKRLTQGNVYIFQRAGKRLRSIQVPAFQGCEQELSFFFERALRMILRRCIAST